MDKLLKQAKLEGLKKYADKHDVKVAELHSVITGNAKKTLEKIRQLIPEAKIFDCHKLKATVLDLEKSGIIYDLIKQDTPKRQKTEIIELDINKSAKKLSRSGSKSKSSKKESELITPDKKGYGKYPQIDLSLTRFLHSLRFS